MCQPHPGREFCLISFETSCVSDPIAIPCTQPMLGWAKTFFCLFLFVFDWCLQIVLFHQIFVVILGCPVLSLVRLPVPCLYFLPHRSWYHVYLVSWGCFIPTHLCLGLLVVAPNSFLLNAVNGSLLSSCFVCFYWRFGKIGKPCHSCLHAEKPFHL